MEFLTPVLLNVVYGLLFFGAFAIFFATVALFAMAFWDTVGRKVVDRILHRGGATPS